MFCSFGERSRPLPLALACAFAFAKRMQATPRMQPLALPPYMYYIGIVAMMCLIQVRGKETIIANGKNMKVFRHLIQKNLD